MNEYIPSLAAVEIPLLQEVAAVMSSLPHVISTWLHDSSGWGSAGGLCKWLCYVSLRTISTNQPNHESAVAVFTRLFQSDDGDKEEQFHCVNHRIDGRREDTRILVLFWLSHIWVFAREIPLLPLLSSFSFPSCSLFFLALWAASMDMVVPRLGVQ